MPTEHCRVLQVWSMKYFHIYYPLSKIPIMSGRLINHLAGCKVQRWRRKLESKVVRKSRKSSLSIWSSRLRRITYHECKSRFLQKLNNNRTINDDRILPGLEELSTDWCLRLNSSFQILQSYNGTISTITS